jgi:two-component system, NtrC family, sensor histidine kinase HydH
MDKIKRPFVLAIPPWIILGALALLAPIFFFWTLHNLNKQKEDMIRLLTEKGAALIRSFEAGTRTGMMGMLETRGGGFGLQRLLTETAQQQDIVYIIVTDDRGIILAHNDPAEIGGVHGTELDLQRIEKLETVEWRQVSDSEGSDVFEVFRRFAPTQRPSRGPQGGRARGFQQRGFQQREFPEPPQSEGREIIFVGLDMGSLDAARKEDMRHTLLMASALLLIGFTGVILLFLAQAYRTTRTSLTRIQAFSNRVVENMPVGLVAVDENKKLVSLNRAAEEILAAPEAPGRSAREILPREILYLSSALSRGQKEVIADEIECRLADGRVLSLDVSISLLQDEEGKGTGQIILFRDMTEVQALKKEIETSRRLASLGRLAAGIAHEIRNPLSSIKGFATYFRDRYRDNQDDRDTAEVMIKEVDRLNRVISQLLDFARPMALQKKRMPIQALIQHSLKMIERQASSEGIVIQADLAPSLGEIEVDFDRITQVLLNLYLNALEAMDRGGTLSVSCSEDAGNQGVKISVTDTGTGIDKEHLDHIFDPYFTTKQAGSGLGLAIVHKIIEAHGGEVRVESEAKQGTTVTLFLPPAKVDDGKEEKSYPRG